MILVSDISIGLILTIKCNFFFKVKAHSDLPKIQREKEYVLIKAVSLDL